LLKTIFGSNEERQNFILKREKMTEELRELLVGMKLVDVFYCSTGEPILTFQSLDGKQNTQMMFTSKFGNLISHGI